MADTVLDIIINAKDNASNSIRQIGGAFTDVAKRAEVGSAIITGALALASKSAIDTAISFEQSKTAFTTFLGDGDKAGALLQKLSDFAAKTPFDLPQVVTGGQRLLAMGIEADKLIPTFRMLGDISGGSTEKLNSLVLAYGQVKAATRLTGAELRQFTEAGVPLLDMLAAELNKNGGAMVKVGGAAKGTKQQIDSLNLTLQKQNNRLTEMKAKGTEAGASWQNLNLDIENNKKRLESLSQTSAIYTKKVKVDANSLREMIEDGKISFEQVDAALKKATSEGGRFFNAMEAQSKTLGGVISNTRDEVIRFALNIMGMSTSGDIRKGSIFYYLKDSAEKLLVIIKDVRPEVQKFVDGLLTNRDKLAVLGAALAGLFAPLLLAIAPTIAAALAISAVFATVTQIFITLRSTFQSTAIALGVLSAATAGLSVVWAVLSGAFAATPIGLLITSLALLAAGTAVMIEKTKLLKTQQDLVRDATQQVIDKERELTDARKYVTDTARALESATLAVEGSTLRVDRAQATYNETLKKYGPNALETKEADYNLKQARDDLEGATIRVKEATGAKQKAEEEVVKKTTEFQQASETRQKEVEKEAAGYKTLGDRIRDAINLAWEYAKMAIDPFNATGKSGGPQKRMHGGIVPGGSYDEVPTILHGGERVIPRNGVDVNPSTTAQSTVNININGSFTLDSDGRVDQLAQRIISMLSRQNEIAGKGLAI